MGLELFAGVTVADSKADATSNHKPPNGEGVAEWNKELQGNVAKPHLVWSNAGGSVNNAIACKRADNFAELASCSSKTMYG